MTMWYLAKLSFRTYRVYMNRTTMFLFCYYFFLFICFIFDINRERLQKNDKLSINIRWVYVQCNIIIVGFYMKVRSIVTKNWVCSCVRKQTKTKLTNTWLTRKNTCFCSLLVEPGYVWRSAHIHLLCFSTQLLHQLFPGSISRIVIVNLKDNNRAWRHTFSFFF